MSRRHTVTARKKAGIPRLFVASRNGVSFACPLWLQVAVALSCAPVGGCLVTSAEEFPEEAKVPPIVVDTAALPIGSIIAFDQMKENELALLITTSDANLDDELELRARLSVAGQNYESICGPIITPSGEARREQARLAIQGPLVRKGVCSKLEVRVSSKFAIPCEKTMDDGGFGVPADPEDLGIGTFWIWEMSGDPAANAAAAQNIVTSCQTLTRPTMTTPPATMVP